MSRVFKEEADDATKYDFEARALDQFSDKIASASSIFIEPNLVSKEPYPTTTDPPFSIRSWSTSQTTP